MRVFINKVRLNIHLPAEYKIKPCHWDNATGRAIEDPKRNPNLKGNMRDYASLNELLVLANMESYNAVLIEKGLSQKERMIELRKLARTQIISLQNINNNDIKKLEKIDG